MHELYASKEALDAAGTGAADAMGETFEQLDELLVTLGASEGGGHVGVALIVESWRCQECARRRTAGAS